MKSISTQIYHRRDDAIALPADQLPGRLGPVRPVGPLGLSLRQDPQHLAEENGREYGGYQVLYFTFLTVL